MQIRKITIKNFKAIEETTLDLIDFNVIVGINGSGKSSVLQALHWMFQSGRNQNIQANQKKTDGATLSEKDATYMPSPDYRNAGHGQEYGNRQEAPKLDLLVEAEGDDGTLIRADMWIKSARNEGISVHVPSGNPFVATLRDQAREFSAYIPGLAGIPLSEEKRSKLIVQRLAAAGDANTVLRNVLDLLRAIKIDEKDGLTIVQDYVSRVMGGFNLAVEFEDDKQTNIFAQFQTNEMKRADAKRFKPLELAGIGFLQVIQIFAYLVYFRPVLLLVDEPDSHLHPMAQERLVTVLCESALQFKTQVILTTHSPSVVRALPPNTRVIWMKDGKVQPNGDTEARKLMGWGLLDRRILLMTEDTGTEMLRMLMSQWPDLERMTAIWPFHGSSKLPPPETIEGLSGLFGGSLRIVIHRDRDFMMKQEVDTLAKPYREKGFEMWFTQFSDIESYWTNTNMIASHFSQSPEDAETLLNDAVAAACADGAAIKTRRRKRGDTIKQIGAITRGEIPQFGDEEIKAEYKQHGLQYTVLGKDLAAAIRHLAQTRRMPGAQTFGRNLPTALTTEIAVDLRDTLKSVIV
jgi:ABC-type cobalamin/Fe3+-siderophores transport system ATPase subunit